MSRNMLLFLLLLATGAVLADDPPETGPADAAVEAPATAGEVAPDGAQAEPAADASDPGDGDPAAKPTGEAPDAGTVSGDAEMPSSGEATGTASEAGDADTEDQPEDDPQLTHAPGGSALGMSILGNQEAPKSLVIVPWKSSVIGDSLGISTMLDDSKQPVDREVFLRALSYYEIRSEKTP
jgi:hypothetical protein